MFSVNRKCDGEWKIYTKSLNYLLDILRGPILTFVVW